MFNSFDLGIYYRNQRYEIHIGTYTQSLKDIRNLIGRSFKINMNDFLIEIYDEIHKLYFILDEYYLEDLRTDSSLAENKIISARIRPQNQSAFNMINDEYEMSDKRCFEVDEVQDDHIVIWLDDHIGKPENCNSLKLYLAHLIDFNQQTAYSKIYEDTLIDSLILTYSENNSMSSIDPHRRLVVFSEIDQCMEFIYEMSKKRRSIFIIVSDLWILKLLPQIFDNVYIRKIYVFLSYLCPVRTLANKILEHPDKVNIFDHETDLFIRLIRDIARYYVHKASFKHRNLYLRLSFLTWAKLFSEKANKIDPLLPPPIELKSVKEQIRKLEESCQNDLKQSFFKCIQCE